MNRAAYEQAYANTLRELLSGEQAVERITATLHRTEHETYSDLVFSVAHLPGIRFGLSGEIWSDGSPPGKDPEFAAELAWVNLHEQLEADDLGLPENPLPDRVNWLDWAHRSSGQPPPDR